MARAMSHLSLQPCRQEQAMIIELDDPEIAFLKSLTTHLFNDSIPIRGDHRRDLANRLQLIIWNIKQQESFHASNPA